MELEEVKESPLERAETGGVRFGVVESEICFLLALLRLEMGVGPWDSLKSCILSPF